MTRIEHKGAHGDGSSAAPTVLFEHEPDQHPALSRSKYQSLVNKLRSYGGTGSLIVTGGNCKSCESVTGVVSRNSRVGPFS